MTASDESVRRVSSDATEPALPRADDGRWSLGTALAAAIGASICCLGPLALLAVGVGGAWAGTLTVLEPLRPIFVTLALAALGYAFYRVYRPGAGCAADGTCTHPRRRRRQRAAVWLTAAVILALLASPYAIEGLLTDTGAEQAQAAIAGEQISLSIDGMTCASCTVAVRQSLLGVEGVQSVRISYEPPEAVVHYDAARTSPAALTEATAEAGYPSQLLEHR